MIDLTKLTPAPWAVGVTDASLVIRCADEECDVAEVPWNDREQNWQPHDAAFIALARNAFQVMMERGWYPAKVMWEKQGPQWGVVQPSLGNNRMMGTLTRTEPYLWPDPFTALVEADKWYRENIEKEQP